MTAATIARSIDFLGAQMAARDNDELELVLFGGEPLLRPDLCLRVLEAATSKLNLREASMVTNGVRLSPVTARRLAHAGLTAVQVTLDGDRAAHDDLRRTPAGGATYDRILSHVGPAAEAGLALTIRINVTLANLDTIPVALGTSARRSARVPRSSTLRRWTTSAWASTASSTSSQAPSSGSRVSIGEPKRSDSPSVHGDAAAACSVSTGQESEEW